MFLIAQQFTRTVTSVPGSPSLRRPRPGVLVDGWCLWRLSRTGWSLIRTGHRCGWADDDEDRTLKGTNHENPLVPEVHPAVPAVIPEDVGLSEAGSLDVEESEVGARSAHSVCQGVAVLRAAFLLLDGVSLVEEMQDRACIMKSVPRFMRGNYRIAMRTALEEICVGERTREEARAERGWKLFILLPRDVVAPPSKRRAHSTGEVDQSFRVFREGRLGKPNFGQSRVQHSSGCCSSSPESQNRGQFGAQGSTG